MLTLRKLESLELLQEISGRQRYQQFMAMDIMRIIQ